MPMELSHSTLLEMLLSARNIGAGRNISDDLLANPTAIEDSGFRLTEAPFQVRYDAIVCTRSTEVVWILEIDLEVCST